MSNYAENKADHTSISLIYQKLLKKFNFQFASMSSLESTDDSKYTNFL
jgi:hypothetical protein